MSLTISNFAKALTNAGARSSMFDVELTGYIATRASTSESGEAIAADVPDAATAVIAFVVTAPVIETSNNEALAP